MTVETWEDEHRLGQMWCRYGDLPAHLQEDQYYLGMLAMFAINIAKGFTKLTNDDFVSGQPQQQTRRFLHKRLISSLVETGLIPQEEDSAYMR